MSNRYLLVVLAAKRARQLNRGAHSPGREGKHTKPTSVALEEIAEAKVGYRVKDEDAAQGLSASEGPDERAHVQHRSRARS